MSKYAKTIARNIVRDYKKAPQSCGVWLAISLLFVLTCASVFSPHLAFAATASTPPEKAAKTKEDNQRSQLKMAREALLKRLGGPLNGTAIEPDAGENKKFPALQDDDIQQALKNPLNIPIYRHNPRLGKAGAPVQIIEITDLSCVKCPSYYKQLLDLYKQYPEQVSLVFKHMPQNPYQATNLPTFYSMLAQKTDNFWDFRKELEKLNVRGEQELAQALANAGLDLKRLRRDTRLYAREIYRQLDVDTALGTQYSWQEPPYVYINGVTIGDAIPKELLPTVVEYFLTYHQGKTPTLGH